MRPDSREGGPPLTTPTVLTLAEALQDGQAPAAAMTAISRRTELPTLDPVEHALEKIAAGLPAVVVDDEARENEGDLIVAAEMVTPDIVAFMMRECRGLLCTPMTAPELERLHLPQMVEDNSDSMNTAFTVSVDATRGHGVTTGISAADRATTIRLLASGSSSHNDFTRPGHVFPLRACPGGVMARGGHTEAGIDLARLAGLRPAAAICEIADGHGKMLRLTELIPFARQHGFPIISIKDLVTYREANESTVVRETETRMPLASGDYHAYGYRSILDGTEHIALVQGDIGDGDSVLVRIHSECLTGDAFASQRCDCGPQLRDALDQITTLGRGVVLYLRGHEGRGIGLLPKLRAYQLQEQGRDTLEANLELGLPADARDYRAAADMLTDLGVRTVRLLTNNPEKAAALVRHGLRVVRREPLAIPASKHNLLYLRTKRDRMGHDLPDLESHSTVSRVDIP